MLLQLLMKLSKGKILLLLLFIIAATVFVAVYISINQSRKVNQTFLRISDSQNALYHADKLLSASERNEIMIREYVLTGDEEYLIPLAEMYNDIQYDYKQLSIYTKSNLLQQKKVDSLPFYINGGQAWTDSVIIVRRNEGQVKAMQLISTDTIRHFVRNARALVGDIMVEGRKLLKAREQANVDAVAGFKKIWYWVIALLIALMIMLTQKLRVDITVGRKINSAIQYNALLMEHVQDAVISTDENFAVVRWSRKAEAISGWTEPEVRGKIVADVVKPVNLAAFESGMVKDLLKAGSWEGEMMFHKKNGERISVLLSAAIIKSDNGKMKGMVAVATDITAQKQIEEELTKFNSALGKQVEDRTSEVQRVVNQVIASEKKYKLLFENNPLPMWMLNMSDMNIVDVNKAAVHHYGYTRREFLTLNMKDIHPQADFNGFIRDMQNQPSEQHTAGVWRQYKKNRSIIFVEIYTYSMKLEGRDIRLVLSHDITQKIEAEKKLTQSLGQIRMLTGHLQEVREEERKNIARDIHDELGQQLTVLKMDVSWIIRKLQNPDEIIVTQLKGLLGTIDGTMKSVRRICSELRPALLDDIGLIAAMEWQAREFEKNTAIAVELTLPAEVPGLLPDIKTGLFRIFQESLTNIARHAQARQVKVNLQVKDKLLILNIEDNGRGFDTSILNKKRTLGILGMEERSLMMGGKYIIKSEPGEGTTVKVTVPAEKENVVS